MFLWLSILLVAVLAVVPLVPPPQMVLEAGQLAFHEIKNVRDSEAACHKLNADWERDNARQRDEIPRLPKDPLVESCNNEVVRNSYEHPFVGRDETAVLGCRDTRPQPAPADPAVAYFVTKADYLPIVNAEGGRTAYLPDAPGLNERKYQENLFYRCPPGEELKLERVKRYRGITELVTVKYLDDNYEPPEEVQIEKATEMQYMITKCVARAKKPWETVSRDEKTEVLYRGVSGQTDCIDGPGKRQREADPSLTALLSAQGWYRGRAHTLLGASATLSIVQGPILKSFDRGEVFVYNEDPREIAAHQVRGCVTFDDQFGGSVRPWQVDAVLSLQLRSF